MAAKLPADKLKQIDAIKIVCEDCGRSRCWTRIDIQARDVSGEMTVAELGDRLFCRSCRAQGGLGYNIEIRQIHPMRRAG